jgi:hypothetical protein
VRGLWGCGVVGLWGCAYIGCGAGLCRGRGRGRVRGVRAAALLGLGDAHRELHHACVPGLQRHSEPEGGVAREMRGHEGQEGS